MQISRLHRGIALALAVVTGLAIWADGAAADPLRILDRQVRLAAAMIAALQGEPKGNVVVSPASIAGMLSRDCRSGKSSS